MAAMCSAWRCAGKRWRRLASASRFSSMCWTHMATCWPSATPSRWPTCTRRASGRWAKSSATCTAFACPRMCKPSQSVSRLAFTTHRRTSACPYARSMGSPCLTTSSWSVAWVQLLSGAKGARMAHVVFGLVLVVNLVATSVIAANHLEPFADLATYYQEGQMLAQGRGFTQPIKLNVHSRFTEAPYPIADRLFFPIAVAAALSLFGDSLAVANVVAAASMALTALPLYLLGRQLFDSRVALLAIALFALNPFYYIVGIQAWTDLSATLFYYLCLLALASYFLSPSSANALLSGAWLTLAALTREESILLVLPLVVVWWWRGRNLAHGALFALAPLTGFGLRAVYLAQTFGNPLYTERPYFLLPRWSLWYYLGTFTPQEYLDYVGGIGGALAIRLYNYARFVENIFSDGMGYFTQVGLMPALMLFAIGAAYRFPQMREQRRLRLLLTATVAVQLLLSLGYVGYAGN
ncbi:MAG: glycosyltransferase family 39 protein, partial [Chloroflexi bacterium]